VTAWVRARERVPAAWSAVGYLQDQVRGFIWLG
jgi:hypothetical protein